MCEELKRSLYVIHVWILGIITCKLQATVIADVSTHRP